MWRCGCSRAATCKPLSNGGCQTSCGSPPSSKPPAPWPPDLGGIGLDTKDKVQDALKRWCAKLDEKDETEGGGSHDDPANDWVIHPLVDGCKPPPIIT